METVIRGADRRLRFLVAAR